MPIRRRSLLGTGTAPAGAPASHVIAAPQAPACLFGRLLLGDVICREFAVSQRPTVPDHPPLDVFASDITCRDDAPVSVNALFYLKGVAPPEITVGHLYRGIVPFVILQLLGVAVIVGFPELVTWLPSVAYR